MDSIEKPDGETALPSWKKTLGKHEIRVKVGNFAMSDELILNAGDYFATDESGNPSPILKAWPIGGSAHFYSDARIRKLWGFDFKSR